MQTGCDRCFRPQSLLFYRFTQTFLNATPGPSGVRLCAFGAL